MSTEFNERLLRLPAPPLGPAGRDIPPMGERMQIWLIGSREQVQHAINEFYVKRITPDRARFTPIVPAVQFPGKYLSILER